MRERGTGPGDLLRSFGVFGRGSVRFARAIALSTGVAARRIVPGELLPLCFTLDTYLFSGDVGRQSVGWESGPGDLALAGEGLAHLGLGSGDSALANGEGLYTGPGDLLL